MKYEIITVGENDTIKLPRPENYTDCLTLIASDMHRAKGYTPGKGAVILHLLTHPFAPLPWFRMLQHRGLLRVPCRVFYKLACIRHKIDIHLETRIGYGLTIGHGMCMVINGGTVIGNNVNLSQFLNIGTNHSTPAVIGNEVYIAPTVCIVEDVHIGSRATIGAGAVVVKDIPGGSTCAGVPAKVLNYDNPAQYIRNPYYPND